jgi:osmotically-inducible protein OsmY
MDAGALAARIARRIEHEIGVRVAVEAHGDGLRLRGVVDAASARAAAGEIALRAAPGRRVVNALRVVPGAAAGLGAGEGPPPAEEVDAAAASEDAAQAVADLVGAAVPPLEDRDAVEPAFPPTDPVVAPGRGGRLEVLGGFTPTSMSSLAVAHSALDRTPGDEALADAVRRELREDAATTALPVDVAVRRGVAYLTGVVEGLEDAENAEEVAARVPGVVEVVERLRVASL